jgi:phosphoserine phosphatase
MVSMTTSYFVHSCGSLVGDLMHGPAKAEAIRQLAASEGLDLARCAAYSDSVNDLPMLSAVGRAVAVNPDPALRHEARRQGWAVHDFRTGRRAARIAVPTTIAAGLLASAVTTALAARRRAQAPCP